MVEIGQAISFDPKTTIPFEGSRHNALAGAIHQARYVSAIWQRIIAGNQVLQKIDAKLIFYFQILAQQWAIMR